MNTKAEFQLDRWRAEVNQVLIRTVKYNGEFLRWLAKYEKKMKTSVKNPHFFAKLVIDTFNLPIEYNEDDTGQSYGSVEGGNESHVSTFRRYTSILDLLHSFSQGYITVRPTHDDLQKLSTRHSHSLRGADLRFTSSNYLIVLPENSHFNLFSEIDDDLVSGKVEEIYVRVLRGNKAEHQVRKNATTAFDEANHFVLHIILVNKGDTKGTHKSDTELTQQVFIQIGAKDDLYVKAGETIYYAYKRRTINHAPHDLLRVLFNLFDDLNKYSYRESLEKNRIYTK